MTRVLAVSAGLSRPSTTRLLSDRLTSRVEEHLGDALIETVELRELAHQITDHHLVGFAGERLREVLDKVAAADGLILVTPTFAASYSGLFKSFMDIIEVDTLRAKPVLLAATGGTERHSLMLEHAMRPLLAYQRAAPVVTAVYAAGSDWGSDVSLAERIDRSAAELAEAATKYRPAVVADEFDEPREFARLLHGD